MYPKVIHMRTYLIIGFLSCAMILTLFGCGSRMVTENAATNEVEVIKGSHDVRLAVTLHVDRILSQIEQQASEDQLKDRKAAALIDWRERVGLDFAEIYLVNEEQDKFTAIVVIPDVDKKIWNELSTSSLFNIYLDKDADGDLQPVLETLPQETAELHESLRQLKIKWHNGRIVIASPERLKLIEGGTWNVETAITSQLANRVYSDTCLFTCSAIVPKEFDFDLEDKLKTSEAAKAIPPAGNMILGMFTSFLKKIRDQLNTMDAFAVSVSLPSENQRKVRYVQLFHDDRVAAIAHTQLTTPVAENDADGLVLSVAELLQNSSVQQDVRRFGRLLEIDVGWSVEADKVVSSLLGSPVTRFVFAQSVGASLVPSKSVIQTHYTIKPHFVTLTTSKLQSAVEQQLQRQLFL